MKNAVTAPDFSTVAESPAARELRMAIENGHVTQRLRFQAEKVFDEGMRMIDEGADPEMTGRDIVRALKPALRIAEGTALFYIQATIGSLQKALGINEDDTMDMAS